MAKKRPKFQKERPPDQSGVDIDWRLFVAIPMPPAARALAEQVTAALARHDWPVRWVATESAHLTLHFLGDTPPEQGELIRMALGPAVARHRAFELTTAQLGLFPDDRDPRVLWLGLDGDTDALATLHRDIGRRLVGIGSEVEIDRFHPHITLGRVRDDRPARLPAEIRAALADPAITALVANPAPIRVDRVELVRSFLDRSGARHEPIATFNLAPS